MTARRQRGAALHITSAGGSFEAKVGPQPDPDLLIDRDGVVAKFAHNAAASLDSRASQSFGAALLDGAPAMQMRDLWRMLVAGASATPAKAIQEGV
jgi:hypothetical protein